MKFSSSPRPRFAAPSPASRVFICAKNSDSSKE